MELAKPESVGICSERLGRIHDLMDRYVGRGKMAGLVSCLYRRGHLVQFDKSGYQDLNARTPMALDTIFRIYSMTEPIACTALMMLFERSLFNLTDPVSEFIPAFGDVKVMASTGELVEPVRPITIQDLFRHTAGLTYGGFEGTPSPVDRLYNEAGLSDPGLSNQEFIARLTRLPLMYHPGTKWHYSMATDVIGHLVELLSGQSLADFLQSMIFEPLGMVDTAFSIHPADLSRFATLYGLRGDDDLAVLDEPANSDYLSPVVRHGGGSGLLSTVADYLCFARCILNRGELDGARLLGPKTVDLMTANHLPVELLPIAFEGTEPMLGMGYGLGFGVMLDAAQSGVLGSSGDYSWGGYAETYFWIDPSEDLIAILMAQYLPSQTYPIRKEFRSAVYQALLD
jgi:CubicO group peptidase (beta-lactamase class C family)